MSTPRPITCPSRHCAESIALRCEKSISYSTRTTGLDRLVMTGWRCCPSWLKRMRAIGALISRIPRRRGRWISCSRCGGSRGRHSAPHMGGRSRVSDFFSGRRLLSTAQVGALRELLGIPADLLIPRHAQPRRPRARRAA